MAIKTECLNIFMVVSDGACFAYCFLEVIIQAIVEKTLNRISFAWRLRWQMWLLLASICLQLLHVPEAVYVYSCAYCILKHVLLSTSIPIQILVQRGFFSFLIFPIFVMGCSKLESKAECTQIFCIDFNSQTLFLLLINCWRCSLCHLFQNGIYLSRDYKEVVCLMHLRFSCRFFLMLCISFILRC